MTWDDDMNLVLVAADAPRRDAGAVVGRPVVRYKDGLYVIRRVDENPPALLSPVSKDEFDRRLRSGAWMETPAWRAQRGYLTLATSEPFRNMLRRVPQAERCTRAFRFHWLRRDDVELTYARRTALAEWMKAVATAVLAHVEEDLVAAKLDRAQLRSDLAQVIFLTTEQRKPRPAEARSSAAESTAGISSFPTDAGDTFRDDYAPAGADGAGVAAAAVAAPETAVPRDPRDGDGRRRLRMYLDLAVLDREVIPDVSPGVLSALRREFGYSAAEARDRVDEHWGKLTRGRQIFKEMVPSSQRAAVFA